MPLELFPYLLLRSTALPLDYLKVLQWPKSKVWQDLLDKEAKHYLAKKNLLENLSSIIGSHPDYKAKNTLANLYKDILKERKVNSSKYQNLLHYSPAALEFLPALEHYLKEGQSIETDQSQWQEIYQKELPKIRAKFQKSLQQPALLKALPLSSISIHYRLKNYLAKDVAIHRKKEWQTERTALQFLTRVATKTSPFSTYTTLSIQNLKDASFAYPIQNSVRLNNHILSLLQEGLEQIPGFYRQMLVKVNPSLRLEKEKWKYILNSKNVESLQEIERQDLLDLFLEKLQEGGKVFQEVVSEALQFIEADIGSIEGYLLQLLDLGLLEWEWGISGNEHLWLEQLKEHLNTLEDFQGSTEVLAVLSFLKKQKDDFLKAKSDERVVLMKDTEKKLIDFFQAFLPKRTTEEEEEIFTRIKSETFHFKAEKLFYEDQNDRIKLEIDQQEITKILAKLDQLTDLLHPLALTPLHTEVWMHLEEKYPNQKQVDLLTFYDSFYRNRNNTVFKDAVKNQEIDQIFKGLEKAKADQTGKVFNLSLAQINSILESLTPGVINAQKGKGQGGLFHFYKNKDGGLQTFLEANFMGYGKMMGRFLHLFPASLSTEIRDWNKDLAGESCWVENVDASYFNANLHPRLLTKEIASPGSQNILEAKQQIAVIDLEIVRDENRKLLYLRHKPSQKEVMVFNFGFEALASRSSMYQLLQSFGYQNAAMSILTNLTDQVTLEKWSNGVLFLPRLVIDECLVLQRKRWYFPAAIFPSLAIGTNQDAAFFLAIQRWKECWELPSQFFIRLQPLKIPGVSDSKEASAVRKTDDYKPQYMDLDNPLLVQLLGRLLRKVEGMVLIEEMLPDTALEASGRAVEALVEWKKA